MQSVNTHHADFSRTTNSTIDALPAIMKILGTFTRNIYGPVIVHYNYRWQIGQLELLKRTLLKRFFWEIFGSFSFSEHSLRNVFLETCRFLIVSSPITLTKRYIYRPFTRSLSCKLVLISVAFSTLYLDFCVFVKSTDFEICGVITGISI